MAKLENLTVGCMVRGLVSNESVEVVAIKWFGSNVIEITYKNQKGRISPLPSTTPTSRAKQTPKTKQPPRAGRPC